jgi:hypothetical protein
MSDNVQWVVDLDASLDEAQVLAARVKDWLLAQSIVSNTTCAERSYRGGELLLPGPNAAVWSVAGDGEFPSMHGFGIVTERTVFHTGDNGIQGLRCPRCAQEHDPDDVAWSDAVGAWFDKEKQRCAAVPGMRMREQHRRLAIPRTQLGLRQPGVRLLELAHHRAAGRGNRRCPGASLPARQRTHLNGPASRGAHRTR